MVKVMLLLLFFIACFNEYIFAAQPYAAGVCNCAAGSCSLIPPNGSKNPCYEGSPTDAAKCFQTDPLLASGTTWACGTSNTQCICSSSNTNLYPNSYATCYSTGVTFTQCPPNGAQCSYTAAVSQAGLYSTYQNCGQQCYANGYHQTE